MNISPIVIAHHHELWPYQLQFANTLAPLNQAYIRTTRAIKVAARIMGGSANLFIIDEWHDPSPYNWPSVYEPLRPFEDHRTEFHRGGRYRKPPTALEFKRPKRPGMIRMRDRTGKLVWRDLKPKA